MSVFKVDKGIFGNTSAPSNKVSDKQISTYPIANELISSDALQSTM